MRSGRIRVTVFIPTLVSCVIASHALAQSSYFQNKTIKIIRAGEPGAREICRREPLIPFLKQHVPDEPHRI